MSPGMVSGESELDAQPERPDVFVSYSRKDEVFVRRLVAALTAHAKDVWVDWEDIRKAADWRARIESGINSSRAVVAVLTPDSIVSSVCETEIAYAVRQNKRLVPIVRRDFDGVPIREELNAPNWIFLRDSDDFGGGVEELVDALETDFAWTDAHARLIVRAREWERNGREGSFLLRGVDLRAAEQWFAQQASHRERATPLQGEYILASRQLEKRRQRITLGAVFVALMLALGLAVLAWVQRNDAVAQKHVAEERAKVAISRELATRASSKLSADPELSILLAQRAADAAETPEALIALRQALSESRVRAVLRPGYASYAVLSADGERVVTVGEDTARITNLTTKKRTGPRWHIRTSVQVAAISPDGRFAITSAGDDVATLRDVVTGKTRAVLRSDGCCARGAAFSADSRLVAVASHDITVWDVATGKRVAVLTHPGDNDFSDTPNGVAFAANTALIAAPGNDGNARVWNVATRKLVMTVRADDDYVWSVAFSPDGKRFATGGEDGSVRVWELARGRQSALLRGHLAPVHSASFSPDGTRLLTASEDGTARIWELGTERALVVLRGHIGRVWSAAFSRDSSLVVTTGQDGTTRLWDVADDRPIAAFATSVIGAAFTPDGTHVLTGTEAGAVRKWNPSTGTSVATLARRHEVDEVAFSPDRKFVGTTDWRGRIRIQELATGRTMPLPDISVGAFSGGAFSADGGLVVALNADDGGAWVWVRTTGRAVAVLNARSAIEELSSAVLSPDGRLALTTGNSPTLWDVKSGKRVARLGGQDDATLLAEFSPNGRLAMTMNPCGRTEVWDVATRTRIAVLKPGPTCEGSTYPAARFSPDSKLVVVVREDHTAEVWDIATESLVRVLDRHGIRVNGGDTPSIAFSPNGRRIVVAGPDGVARLYECDICVRVKSLLTLARTRVTRNLTSAERARYLHEPVKKTARRDW